MSLSPIETAAVGAKLNPSPIEPSWIIDGDPQASSCMLSWSADGSASTIVWQCTEGRFEWHYDFDETILILEGSIVLESDTMKPTRYGPGDVILFRNGASAKWHVEGHVKKLAFCRTTPPPVIAFATRALRALKRMFMPPAEHRGAAALSANPQ